MTKYETDALLKRGRELLAAAPVTANSLKLKMREWYAKHSYLKNGKTVDWKLMDYRRKEYYRTGTTRVYMRRIGRPIERKRLVSSMVEQAPLKR